MADHPLLKAVPDGQYVEIDGDSLFLGRDCHLAAFIPALLNKVVSNRHCVVRREAPDRWMLEDLGSTNGTWIRGTRLNGKTLLHTGDTFSLGKAGPVFECARGFGGTGPDATIEERQAGAAARRGTDMATLLDPDLSAKTILASGGPPPRAAAPPVSAPAKGAPPHAPDGTMDRPYRAGRMPAVKLRHERAGLDFEASGYTIVLGRDPAAQVVIRSDEDKHVSGRHAEIQFRNDGSVVLRDLGSRNGTWLNNQRVKDEDAPLRVGDRILLGAAATILLVKRLDGSS